MRVAIAAGAIVSFAFACGTFLEDSATNVPDNPTNEGGASDVGVAPNVDGSSGEDACSDCAPVLLVANVGELRVMGLTATDVFVATRNRIVRLPKSGLKPGELPVEASSGSEVTDLSADDVRGFATTWDLNVYAVPLDGGKVENVSIGSACLFRNFSITAADPQHVYYTTRCNEVAPVRVQRAKKYDFGQVGSGTDALMDGGVALYRAKGSGYIAVDTTKVYWSNAHAILTLPLGFAGNAQPTQLVAVDDETIFNLAVVDGQIYVRTQSDVRSFASTGGVPTKIATNLGSEAEPGDLIRLPLAVSGNDVYYSKVSPPTIHRVDKAGSPVADLATATSTPVSLAVDATHVYWATKDGEVWRMRR